METAPHSPGARIASNRAGCARFPTELPSQSQAGTSALQLFGGPRRARRSCGLTQSAIGYWRLTIDYPWNEKSVAFQTQYLKCYHETARAFCSESDRLSPHWGRADGVVQLALCPAHGRHICSAH